MFVLFIFFLAITLISPSSIENDPMVMIIDSSITEQIQSRQYTRGGVKWCLLPKPCHDGCSSPHMPFMPITMHMSTEAVGPPGIVLCHRNEPKSTPRFPVKAAIVTSSPEKHQLLLLCVDVC